MNRSWRKQIDFQNANTAVMNRRRKSPGQISKVVNNSNPNSYTEKNVIKIIQRIQNNVLIAF